FNGADRSVNPEKAQLGVLRSIQYPTGGQTNFIYESNEVNDTQLGPQNFEDRELFFASIPGVPVVDMPYTLPVSPLVVPSGGAHVDLFQVTGLDPSSWPGCDAAGIWLTKDGEIHSKLENINSTLGFLNEGTYGLVLIHECPPQAVMPSVTIKIHVKVPIN